MWKMIRGWKRMENPNLSADLAPSLSSSPHTSQPPSSLHPSTPPSPPTRATCAPQYVCLITPPLCRRTHPHPFCPLCARAQVSTSPPSWPTLRATKACPLRLRPNLRHAVCCAPVSSSFLHLQVWSEATSAHEVRSFLKLFFVLGVFSEFRNHTSCSALDCWCHTC